MLISIQKFNRHDYQQCIKNSLLRLADILVSDDPFLRERVAMIYITIASQSNGGVAITGNPLIISNLVKSLSDRLACVRLRAAEVLEMLARNWKSNFFMNNSKSFSHA